MLEWYVIKTVLALVILSVGRGDAQSASFCLWCFCLLSALFCHNRKIWGCLYILLAQTEQSILAFRFCCWQLCSVLELLLHLPPLNSVLMFPFSLEMQGHLGKPEGHLSGFANWSLFFPPVPYFDHLVLRGNTSSFVQHFRRGKKQNCLQFVKWWSHAYARLWPSSRLNIYRPLSPSTPTM